MLLVPPGHDFMGRAISFCEHDPICHIAVDLGDEWAIAEEGVGCWARPIEQYGNPAVLRYPLQLTSAEELLVTTWLRQHVGTGYAYRQIAADALELHGLPALDEHDGKYVCSSLIAKALAVAAPRVYPFGTIPPEQIRPDHWHALYAGAALPQGVSIVATIASAWAGIGPKAQLTIETVLGAALGAGSDALFQQLQPGAHIDPRAVGTAAAGAAALAVVRLARRYIEASAPAAAAA